MHYYCTFICFILFPLLLVCLILLLVMCDFKLKVMCGSSVQTSLMKGLKIMTLKSI